MIINKWDVSLKEKNNKMKKRFILSKGISKESKTAIKRVLFCSNVHFFYL